MLYAILVLRSENLTLLLYHIIVLLLYHFPNSVLVL